MAKKKGNKLGGVLGAVAVGVGVVAAALLANKKQRANVGKAVSSAAKKAAPVVKKAAKKAEAVLKKEAKSTSNVAKSTSNVAKAAAKSVNKSKAVKAVKKAVK